MAKTAVKPKQSATAIIEVPISDAMREPVIYRVDMGKLSERHRSILNRVWSALREEHATLSTGAHVDSVPDAVRWMLDQIEAGIAEA